ncbi:MAG: LacI family transcriptional regulator [Litoreibacter sp.]
MKKDNEDRIAANGQKRPTLKTIAYMTGLGVATVSKALNDASDIGAETKERVRLVAKQIGYRPNRAGVRLRTGKTNVISLVMAIEHEVLGMSPHLVIGISEVLASTPYHLIVTPYSLDSDPLAAVKYVVESGSADGLILSRIEPKDARVRYLMECNFPFATHGQTDFKKEHPFVDFDNAAYGRLGVDVLNDLGRKKLGLLGAPMNLTYAQYMSQGFYAGIEEHDLIEVPVRNVTVDNSVQEIADAIAKLMAKDHRPDGLVCGSANAAIGATAGIEAAGFVIGEDIDLVVKEGFDMIARFRPQIRVVREDFINAGRGLAKAVLKSIEGAPVHEMQSLEVPKF